MIGQCGANSGLALSNCLCNAFTAIQKEIERVPCPSFSGQSRKTRTPRKTAMSIIAHSVPSA